METIKNMTDIMSGVSSVLATYSNGSLPAPAYITINSSGRIGFQMDNPAKVERWAKSVDKMMKVSRSEEKAFFGVVVTQEFPTLPNITIDIYCVVAHNE